MSETPEERALLVEFIGASGVGKSFLASKVFAALSERGLPVADFQLIKIDLTIRNLLIAMKAALIAWRLAPKSLSEYLDSADRLARHKIRHQISSGSNRICICDEGIFHKIRKLYRSSRSLSMAEVADRVLTYAEIPDVVVIVEARAEEIFTRRLRRNRPDDVFSWSSVREDVLLLEDSMKTIKNTQQRTPDTLQIVQIRTVEGDAQPIAERLAECLEDRFRNPSTFQKYIDLRP